MSNRELFERIAVALEPYCGRSKDDEPVQRVMDVLNPVFDALAAQLERYDGQTWDGLMRERDAAVARAEQAEQAVARVREVHRQLAWPNCHYDNQPWPCITIRALDGTP